MKIITRSITNKFAVINIIIFTLLSVGFIYVGAALISTELNRQGKAYLETNMNVAWSLLKGKKQNFQIVNDRFYAGDNLLNDNNTLVDQIKDMVGGTATIFMGDVRIATNIIKEDGSRAIGTRLAKGPVYDTIFNEGKPYRGEADILGTEYFTAYDPIKNSAGDIIGILYVGFNKEEFLASFQEFLKIIVIMLIGFGVVFCAINYFVIQRYLALPITQATGLLKIIAKGDLSTDLHHEDGDEISELYNTFKKMQDNVSDIIHGIRIGANEVHTAADQVSRGNTDLSQRTQEQASSLEQVASSMEEMTSTVNQNAENANQANQLARSARDQAEQGGEVASQAVFAMNDINEASSRIANIISVIDEIAFQTNLLALNAAVEAARAGEQGRGFAVVANEVRNLAGRCKTAAKEIKELIQDSVHKVEDGTKLVDKSNQALNEIVLSVKKVSDIVSEIAMASQEQSDGIAQVNKALLQMDEMTQQNASLVEQAAAASEAMGAQAEELTASVENFKLSGNEEEYLAAIQKQTVRKIKSAESDRITQQKNKTTALPAVHNDNGAEEDIWQEF